MRPPKDLTRIVDKKRYSVEKSTLIAGDDYYDGHNFERHGRNCFLYKTANGNYFTVNLTQWQGEETSLIPVSLDEAIELYENSLREHEIPYAEAFPGVKVTEA
jgi:hypothetical protein